MINLRDLWPVVVLKTDPGTMKVILPSQMMRMMIRQHKKVRGAEKVVVVKIQLRKPLIVQEVIRKLIESKKNNNTRISSRGKTKS
jgi:hypothetical protein